MSIDLKDTIEDLLLLMEGRFHEIGVEVRAELPEHVTVEGFPAELRQVFTNLITNAAEAAGPRGQVTIRVTATPAEAPRQAAAGQPQVQAGALVEIADDGPGIAPEVLDNLFQPFFTTKGEHGTGLGLWVCQGIIRKHGGLLELRNRAGDESRGAVATVFLSTRPSIQAGAA